MNACATASEIDSDGGCCSCEYSCRRFTFEKSHTHAHPRTHAHTRTYIDTGTHTHTHARTNNPRIHTQDTHANTSHARTRTYAHRGGCGRAPVLPQRCSASSPCAPATPASCALAFGACTPACGYYPCVRAPLISRARIETVSGEKK